jgi:hypothetical protein
MLNNIEVSGRSTGNGMVCYIADLDCASLSFPNHRENPASSEFDTFSIAANTVALPSTFFNQVGTGHYFAEAVVKREKPREYSPNQYVVWLGLLLTQVP